MNNLQTILSTFLIGEPVQDAVTIGILFAIFFEFYKVAFSSIFTIFKR